MTDKIPKGWKKVKLGEIVVTNPENIGKNYPYKEIVYLDTGSITRGKIDALQIVKLTDAPSRAKRLVKNEDIIYSTVRPIQRHYGFITNSPKNLVVSTGFVVIRAKQEKADSKFIYYLLTYDEIVDYLDVIAEGSTSAYPSLRPKDIKNLEIEIPESLEEQKAIAAVLSSLDDKIDLLHRQNKTLEAMAETLYENWISGLEFNSTLRDIIYIQNGFAFKSKTFKDSGYHKVIKIKNISGGIVDIDSTDFVSEDIISKIDKRFKIDTGDVLFAMTGAKIGKMGIIPPTEYSLWLNQRVGLIKEKHYGSRFLAYLHLKSDFGKDYIENTATGSAQPNVSGTGIENCDFPKFKIQEIKEYSYQLKLLFDKVIFNLGQIRTLENLRDTLLPKLMSGEVRVKF